MGFGKSGTSSFRRPLRFHASFDLEVALHENGCLNSRFYRLTSNADCQRNGIFNMIGLKNLIRGHSHFLKNAPPAPRTAALSVHKAMIHYGRREGSMTATA